MTFNVLNQEGRRVAGAFLPLTPLIKGSSGSDDESVENKE